MFLNETEFYSAHDFNSLRLDLVKVHLGHHRWVVPGVGPPHLPSFLGHGWETRQTEGYPQKCSLRVSPTLESETTDSTPK